jgi:hypothetical protein
MIKIIQKNTLKIGLVVVFILMIFFFNTSNIIHEHLIISLSIIILLKIFQNLSVKSNNINK